MITFLFAGIIQGSLLAIYFLFNKTNKNKLAQRWLGLLLLLVSITIGFSVLFINNNFYHLPHLTRIAELFPFLFAPVIYAYTVSLLYNQNPFYIKHLILLVPFLIGLIILLPFYTESSEYKIKIYEEMQKGIYPASYKFLFWLKSLFGLLMLIISIKSLLKAKKEMRQIFAEDREYQWLLYSLFILLLLWGVGTSRALLGFNTPSMEGVAFIVVVAIYILSFFTLKQKQVFRDVDLVTLNEIKGSMQILTSETETAQKNSVPFIDEIINSNKKVVPQNECPRTILQKSEAEKTYNTLLYLVKDGSLFLDKNISLQKLSVQSEIKPNVISETLNKHYNQTFYTFINHLRAKEVALRLQNNDYTYLTIDAIGGECGFKSKSKKKVPIIFCV